MEFSTKTMRKSLDEAKAIDEAKFNAWKMGQQPEDAYKAAKKEVDNNMKKVHAAIAKMDSKAKKDPNWGHIGELGRVNESLIEIIDSLR